MEQDVEHRARRTAARAVGGVAIERVLADVEVEGRKITRRELEERAEDALEVVGRVAFPHALVEFGEAVQHPALELRHLGHVNPLVLGEPREVAQHEAHRVAQAAIAVGDALQDLRPDPVVVGVIHLRHPEPQDVGPVLLDHLVRHDRVAE